MKKLFTIFTLFGIIFYSSNVLSQSGNGHDPELQLSYTPSGYSVNTYMRQDASFIANEKYTINNGSTSADLFVNFTFNTDGKKVYLVYTTDGSAPTKSNGTSVDCSFSYYSDPNRTWIGSISNTEFTSGTTINYVFYISDSDLASSWGRVAGDLGYQTSWTEGDDYYSFDVFATNTSTGGNWSSTSTWENNSVPNSSTVKVEIISSTNDVTLNQNVTLFDLNVAVTGSFTASDGTNGYTLAVANNGSITNNGTFTPSDGTVSFTGAGSVSDTITFNDVNLAGGVDFGSGSTIDGSLTINAGGFVDTSPPTYSGSSTLTYNSGTTYGRSTEWSTTTGAGYPNNVTLSNNTTLNLGANGGTGTAHECAGDFTIGSGSALSLSINDMTKTLTIKGSLSNDGTIELSNKVGGDLILEGDFISNGTFTSNDRAIFFEGGNAQSVSGTNDPINFDYVFISKSADKVTFNQNAFINDRLNITSGNAEIVAGKTLTLDTQSQSDIATGSTLTATGTVLIKSDQNGTGSLIIEGSLSGSITSERHILGYTPSSGDGWHLLSSPVANQAIDGTSFEPTVGTDDLFAWDEENYIWQNYHVEGGGTAFTTFAPGKGYLAAYSATTTHTFSGTPNTADETETLTYTSGQGEGWNLLGNPFQSALKWGDGNWTLGNVQSTAKIYDEDIANYVDIQNGGVDIIPANQGFFVKTSSAGSLTIPKAARVHNATNFYKNTRASSGFLKLRIESEQNSYADVFTIWSNEGASDSYDSYDSEKFYGNAEAPQFFGVVNGENYSTVSYQPAAIEDSRMVNLSLDAPEGEYSVSINTNTLASGTEIFIEDLLTDEFINMNETESFTVNVSESDPAERFVLHLNSTSVSNETLADDNPVKIYASLNQLYIDSEEAITNGEVIVYNTVGQVVATEKMNGNTLTLDINESGAYIVTVRSDKGVSTRKVVIQ